MIFFLFFLFFHVFAYSEVAGTGEVCRRGGYVEREGGWVGEERERERDWEAGRLGGEMFSRTPALDYSWHGHRQR